MNMYAGVRVYRLASIRTHQRGDVGEIRSVPSTLSDTQRGQVIQCKQENHPDNWANKPVTLPAH